MSARSGTQLIQAGTVSLFSGVFAGVVFGWSSPACVSFGGVGVLIILIGLIHMMSDSPSSR